MCDIRNVLSFLLVGISEWYSVEYDLVVDARLKLGGMGRLWSYVLWVHDDSGPNTVHKLYESLDYQMAVFP
jgi:hypothetical protein